MRASLRQIVGWVADLFSSPARPVRQGSRLRLEALEDRVVLSSFAGTDPAVASRCTCALCMGQATTATTASQTSDAYTFSNGGTSAANAAKWSQPGGAGSTVTITYSFANLLDGGLGGGLSAATLKAAVQEALGRWAAVAPLKFVEVADSGPSFYSVDAADYNASGRPMLRFGRVAIDGAYNILAQAYYPGQTGLAGDLFFDQGENWSVNPASGVDFLEVATHEIGHALGLNHESTSRATAIMNPYYASRFRGLGTSFLYTDDINGIRALYGAGTGSVTPLGSGPTTPAYDGRTWVVQGSTLFVFGSTGQDSFVYNASGATPTITLNGVTYSGSLAGITAVQYDGRGGWDYASLTGGSAAEAFSLTPGSASVTGGKLYVSVLSTADIRAYGGAGDALTLTGTAANEALYASSTYAVLASGVLKVSGYGFSTVAANGGGGIDAAALVGTAANETFSSEPTRSYLVGYGWSLSTAGFSHVTAYGMGGWDTAALYGSAGTDYFVATPTASWMYGANYFEAAVGFVPVTGIAMGGSDAAYFYGSAGDDYYRAGTGVATMYALGVYQNIGYGFGTNIVDVSQGGYDRAYFLDSSGNDGFVAIGAGGYFQTPFGVTYFYGFEEQSVTSASGGINSYRLTNPTGYISLYGDWRNA